MIKCKSTHCTAICDFCTQAVHETMTDNNGEEIKGEVEACKIHPEYKDKIDSIFSCNDFHCILTDKEPEGYVGIMEHIREHDNK